MSLSGSSQKAPSDVLVWIRSLFIIFSLDLVLLSQGEKEGSNALGIKGSNGRVVTVVRVNSVGNGDVVGNMKTVL